MLDDHSFALCLTHDVDRPYKTYQSGYYAVAERDPSHLLSVLPGRNSYWQFEEVMALEDSLGVRSAFYFLDEQNLFRDRPVRDWFDPGSWKRYAGRYELSDPAIVDVIHDLDEGGWEVGLHGSYESYDDPERLAVEKEQIESILGREIVGGRQHYLNLDEPDTWRHHADVGLKYDASLGSSSTYGFQYGDAPLRPFDDEFVVFPLTIMEVALPDPTEHFERAWRECRAVLDEAREREAVATILWHPRYFSQRDFPGYGELYRRIVEYALDEGAWVGPPADLYAQLEHPDGDGGSAVEGKEPEERAPRTSN
ncbi:polysaccharide deacetylase family protein [Natronoarchaeum mannanilyticum]|uniref:Polysaccharide deacetylase family protein n=1 Tax=Natronoarchaeum mannanilyticum TaxID=926360 RepID=A0AAV3TCB7_9EURY